MTCDTKFLDGRWWGHWFVILAEIFFLIEWYLPRDSNSIEWLELLNYFKISISTVSLFEDVADDGTDFFKIKEKVCI